ncbi:adhesin [Pseudomonas gessardii]|uniref:Adhesin n=1 Tax=Pseudomonas gessardii TaxID=78544 RepID=A0ABS9F6I3_9PSED|nr:CS1 type fimbrial major subunit [Pseudomonas gessardii]MCF4978884.1 adhesin [Pseudomonas gessardii]MCF5086086.1 adhesin [Pseudomonas gessardii]MCF5094328.1 adhesin [Pseudomonas gessardii]MCF5106970.1 adhesin [Pseudomonas gessardii]NNA88410.1 adhesin [Pseudomonas gessardii]
MNREKAHAARYRSGKLSKFILGTLLLLGAALLSAQALAIREEQVFDVSVTIPTADFYVVPINSQFLEREQEMAWNLVTRTLKPLREHFDVKNSAGGIVARLGQLPTLSNGRRQILLNVSFNGQWLELTDSLVVPADEARAGKRVLLEIAAVEPPDGYVPGDYFGSVHLIFDALLP